ncbi:MAG: adenylyltransferase/cytidyltransferase family protein [Opitutales bacterium]|nr:adenylyltransferase/cytidyltransferase family protein [Opitutales bacterium]
MSETVFPVKNSYSFEEICKIRSIREQQGKSIVLTNGCFDLIHAGHIYSLEKAAALGDELWVALNSDYSVRKIKGNNRPIYSQNERAYLLGALEAVNLTFFFDSTNLAQEIKRLKPDFYAKSGDYSLDNLNPEEHKALKDANTQICFVPFLEGFSTSRTVESIKNT